MDEFASLDATAQAELVRRKEVKPIELVEAAIARVERVNPKLNAVITPMFDIARKTAQGSLPDGPFTGVPFLLKDLTAAYAGVSMTSGSAFGKDFVPDYDSELVARQKKAGLVILGKTNTPEFGILPTTEPHAFGPSRNPWNVEHSTGGSSGGSAAAVAAGMVPMAHGNDGGGSIRIPASCCGLFGLKPTRARNPLGPRIGDVASGLVVEHGLTRSVRDSAGLLDATCGPDAGDPYWAPPRERPYIEEVGADPGKLRIAVTTRATGDIAIHPDCVTAVQEAARLCADLGHHVEEPSIELGNDALTQAFITVFAAGDIVTLDDLSAIKGRGPNENEIEPLTRAMADLAHAATATQYLLSVTVLQNFSRDIARLFLDWDVLLTPVLAEPPLPLGSFDSPDNPLYGLIRAGAYVPFTPLCNITGQPAMSVPLYWNAGGLPVGTHFVGRFGDEATLFRLAAQLEKAHPWAERRPPVWAG